MSNLKPSYDQKENMKKILSLIFFTLCFLLIACTDNGDEIKDRETSKINNISIVSISPTTDETLYVGQIYTIEADIRYSFNTNEGKITLIIQREEPGYSPVSFVIQPITTGENVVTIKSEITVPETRAIQVFAALSAEGDTSSSIVANRIYNVEVNHN